MSDRFKFRVWNSMQKVYSPDDHYISEDGFINTIGDYVLEQCTGLKDKNGKLIYEGDRVKFNKNGNRDGWIIWYLSSWGIETASEFIPMEYPFAKDDPKDIEIVGNIHEENEDE